MSLAGDSCPAAAAASSSSSSCSSLAGGSDTYKGWLFKWTNYLKGYQRRWFVLSNGLLSYYRTQAEMAHTCRGTINLSMAHIDTEDSCNILLSNGGRTYHLKASSEVERQRWVTALELAKARAIRIRSNQSDLCKARLVYKTREINSFPQGAETQTKESLKTTPKADSKQHSLLALMVLPSLGNDTSATKEAQRAPRTP